MKTVTIPGLRAMKAQGSPIVMVTAYDFPTARVAELAGVDIILVGDSGAQVVLGQDSTVEVTLGEMVVLTRATRRGAPSTLIVSDVPFGSTEISDEQAIATAFRLVKEGRADAVKLEGGNPDRLSRIAAITAAGIPVVAHIGLTPQTATALGGLRAQGRSVESAERIVEEALAVEAAGAVAVVVEAVPSEVVAVFAEKLSIPIIGIGAGVADGQVLVMHDLLGITEGTPPKFVKRYASLGEAMVAGVKEYAQEVRSGSFPAPEHQYRSSDDAVASAKQALARLEEH